MRTGLLRLATLLLPLVLVGCGDLPSAPTPGEVVGVDPLFSGECERRTDGTVVCKPISSDDPCEIYDCSGGGDECMVSSGYGSDEITMESGCPPTPPSGGEPIDDGGGDPGGNGDRSGSGTSKPPPNDLESDTCKTQNPMIDDLDVRQAFKDFWAASGVDLAQDQRREQGGWIFLDLTGGYTVVPFAADLTRTPCSIELPATPPAGAVGYIHTHPFAAGELVTVCGGVRSASGRVYPISFVSGSSDADDEVQAAYRAAGHNIKAYVIDANTIIEYDGSGIPQNESKYGRCGY